MQTTKNFIKGAKGLQKRFRGEQGGNQKLCSQYKLQSLI